MLIVPDVHGRIFWRKALESYPDLPTVFLGGYLDPNTHYDGILQSEAFLEFKEILKFKRQNKERVTLLLGNHDIHYFGAKLNFRQFVSSALMDRSASHWGYARYPSIVWADVEGHQYQQRRLPNVYQIFGHTQQEFEPVITEQYANLDCRKAFLLIEDGEIIAV